MSLLSLLCINQCSGNGFQRRTFHFIWVPDLSKYLSYSNCLLTASFCQCSRSLFMAYRDLFVPDLVLTLKWSLLVKGRRGLSATDHAISTGVKTAEQSLTGFSSISRRVPRLIVLLTSARTSQISPLLCHCCFRVCWNSHYCCIRLLH